MLDPAYLRLCDVNCNRAREAMRVLEDHARFVLNHPGLQERLKRLRHDFQSATSALQSRAIAARDTAGDVGTGITTETEASRESPAAVVIAAGKRLGESLRTIEEYIKTTDRAIAREIERIRYLAYDIERDIHLTLSPGRHRLADVRLCVLLSESLCRLPWQQTLEAVIAGGATCVQLREKTLDAGELLARAKVFVDVCRKRGVISIINDRPDIALLAGADGVHVGQGDLPVRAVRSLAGPDKIIGLSTHSIEQAHAGVTDGADYLGVGPVFMSSTKPKEILPGLAYATSAARVGVPTLAISGITAANAGQVMATGVTGLAVSSAVISAADPAAATRQLLHIARSTNVR